MKGSLLFWAIALGAAYLLLFGGASQSSPVRKKILVEIDTPTGTVRGSSVIEMISSTAPWWAPSGTGNRGGIQSRGEAPYVDLGDGRILFVTVNDQLSETPIWMYLQPPGLLPDGHFARGREPMMVTFADMADTDTIVRIRPDAFGEALGRGFSLRNLTATDTEDRPTRGTLAKRFPELHRRIELSSASRTSRGYERGDIRSIGWRAFDGSYGYPD